MESNNRSAKTAAISGVKIAAAAAAAAAEVTLPLIKMTVPATYATIASVLAQHTQGGQVSWHSTRRVGKCLTAHEGCMIDW